jgi:hypothetical protein
MEQQLELVRCKVCKHDAAVDKLKQHYNKHKIEENNEKVETSATASHDIENKDQLLKETLFAMVRA